MSDNEDRWMNSQDRLTEISRWIDGHNAGRTPLEALLLRIVKMKEEEGEMAAEIIGMSGQNPRKGVTSDIDHVVEEALDWAITALGVVEHATGNQCLAFVLLFDKIEKVHGRMLSLPLTASDARHLSEPARPVEDRPLPHI